MSKPLLIVDADTLLWKASCACETEICWDGHEIWTIHTDLSAMKDFLTEHVKELGKKFQYNKSVLCLSSSDNWRKNYYPEYKSNRKKMRKPVGFKQLKLWMKNYFQTLEHPYLEADDACGWLATKSVHKDSLIVSVDKDLKTIPGKLYNEDKDELTDISMEEADRWHMIQWLAGDTVDGYHGIPGIGAKKADLLLGQNPDHQTVLDIYDNKNLSYEYSISQYACSKILRYGDMDLSTYRLKYLPVKKIQTKE